MLKVEIAGRIRYKQTWTANSHTKVLSRHGVACAASVTCEHQTALSQEKQVSGGDITKLVKRMVQHRCTRTA